MKIAILTLPLNVNIGGVLQAYALQHVLESYGHDVLHIQPSYSLPSDKTILKRIIKRFFQSNNGNQYESTIEPEVSDYFTNYHIVKFRKKYLHETPLIDWSFFKRENFDAYIVGSDQIWRHNYAMRYFPNNFLAFTRNMDCKRIAYAASFGTEQWELNTACTQLAKDCVRQFDAISVRELSGVEMCNKHFDVQAHCVLDPTMLLTKEDYQKIIEENDTPSSEGTLLSYLLNTTTEFEEIIRTVAIQNRLIPFRVNNPNADHWELPAMERQQSSVYKWLQGFRNSELIITDSFHACVFSIIFNKPFIVVGNKARGVARFETLLSTFGLMDRLLDVDTCTTADFQRLATTPINYEDVNVILTQKRKESMDFLTNALKKTN